MNNVYNEKYFKTKNYKNYLDKEERYFKSASELYNHLQKFSLIDKNTRIIDYGCSVGFFINGFVRLGFENIVGYDISEWAVNQAKNSGCKILSKAEGKFEFGFFLDVLEHMSDKDILDLFENLLIDKIIVRIPCAIELNPNQFHLEISKLDETHINCKTDKEWQTFFKNLGYTQQFRLNFSTIYDSPGCFCCLLIK
jgi:hypothetical protein